MKRASKPPTPPQPSRRDDPSRPRVPAGPAPGKPPPLPTAGRSASPFAAAPPLGPRPVEGPDPITEDLGRDELDTHRPAAPTIPLVSTPNVDWAVGPDRMVREPPSSHSLPTAPKRPASDRSMEASLRDQIWSGLKANPANPIHTAQTGPHLPLHLERASGPGSTMASRAAAAPPTATASGTYRTISEQREGSVPRSDRTPAAPDDGWPLGYIVASAFFLAIAVVGFGLWLAFEVISL
jgi:hypothetical protein